MEQRCPQGNHPTYTTMATSRQVFCILRLASSGRAPNIASTACKDLSHLTLSGADVDFLNRELRWRTYTTEEAVPTTRRVELVGKKEL